MIYLLPLFPGGSTSKIGSQKSNLSEGLKGGYQNMLVVHLLPALKRWDAIGKQSGCNTLYQTEEWICFRSVTKDQ